MDNFSQRSQQNPFLPGTAIQDADDFIGREQLLDTIISNILSLRNTHIHGERRTGKTSLLNYLANPTMARGLGLPSSYVPVLFNFQSFPQARGYVIWERMIKAIADALGKRMPGNPLAGNIRQVIKQYPADQFPNREVLLANGLITELSQVSNEDLHLVLLFDEFENTASNPYLGKPFFDLLRSLEQSSHNLCYIIASRLGLSNIEGSAARDIFGSSFFNIFTTLYLPVLSEEEVIQFIRRYLGRAGLEESTTQLLIQHTAQLFDLTGYHPYFLQLFCNHLFEEIKNQKQSFDAAWQAALKGFKQDSAEHFKYYWSVSLPQEKEALSGLARGEPGVSLVMLLTLQARCLARKDEAGWRLFSSAFQEWIVALNQTTPAPVPKAVLSNDTRTSLINLLLNFPKLSTWEGREVWLLNLPRQIRVLVPTRDQHNPSNDLAFIIEAIQTIQYEENQRWALVDLLEALLPEMEGLALGKKLSELIKKVEADLNAPALEPTPKKSEQQQHANPEAEPSWHESTSKTEHQQTAQPDASEPEQTWRSLWLKSLGFDKDPFYYQNGSEDPQLASYFYKVPFFNQILGSDKQLTPIFAFGWEGSGKGSLRNAISQLCAGKNILPVIYQDFRPLAALQQTGKPVTIQDHAEQLARALMRAAFAPDQLDKLPERMLRAQPEARNRKILINYLWPYAVEYLSDSPDPLLLSRIQGQLQPDLPTSLLQELQTQRLPRLVGILRPLLGYQAVYFLVDPDPAIDFAPNPDIAWEIWAVLLTDFYQIKSPPENKVAFKFFIDELFYERVIKIPWIANHAGSIYRPLEWTSESLSALIRERLSACSTHERQSPYVSLNQISEVPDLDQQIVQAAHSSPRRLVSLCNKLFDIHTATKELAEIPFFSEAEINQVLFGYPNEISLPENIARGEIRLTQGNLASLATLPESQYLELKSSLRYNKDIAGRDPRLEMEAALTLAGFMNAEGGILIIGIDDAHSVLGLENDYSRMNGRADMFERVFWDLIKNVLELAAPREITFKIMRLESKEVAVVVAQPRSQPVYVKDDQKGMRQFYVRTGNRTELLDAKRAIEYYVDHFQKPGASRRSSRNKHVL